MIGVKSKEALKRGAYRYTLNNGTVILAQPHRRYNLGGYLAMTHLCEIVAGPEMYETYLPTYDSSMCRVWYEEEIYAYERRLHAKDDNTKLIQEYNRSTMNWCKALVHRVQCWWYWKTQPEKVLP